MEIFYLSRCCRRRANAKQPLLVLRRQAPPSKDFPVAVPSFWYKLTPASAQSLNQLIPIKPKACQEYLKHVN